MLDVPVVGMILLILANFDAFGKVFTNRKTIPYQSLRYSATPLASKI